MHFPFLIKIHAGQMEKPQILLRRHAILFIRDIILYLFLLAIPFIAGVLEASVASRWLTHETGGPLMVLGVAVYEIFILLLFFTAFLDYYLDLWVVTDERILDIDQEGVFLRKVSELALHNIQDVHVEVKRVFATLFNFGTIEVQTAGAEQRFEFDGIPDPQKVSRQILELAHDDARFHDAIAGNE